MPRKHWLRLAARVGRLWLAPPQRTPDLVRQSYDRLAAGYDDAWTHHMRRYSLQLLNSVAPQPGEAAIDLTCGTGYVTAELARCTNTRTIGVDASAGMLDVARAGHGDTCEFIHADAAEYLRNRPDASADVITCVWGLGYSRPWRIVRQAARVLRPGGRLGIIDNTLFSLAGVVWVSTLAFAEQPKALIHAMNVRFLPTSLHLATLMRMARLGVPRRWDGEHTYHVENGRAAHDRLTTTGAAAGFEFAADPAHENAIQARFQKLMERRRGEDGIPITHRYLAAVGCKQ